MCYPDAPLSTSVESVRPTICGHAEACLETLQRSRASPEAEAAVRTAGGWTVLLAVFPTPASVSNAGLTECDCDCLKLLAQLSLPISGARVCKELEARHIGVWSIATVKRSLAKLHHLQLICNSRSKPQGYYLLERRPLLEQLARR
jgi:hypothetical protein